MRRLTIAVVLFAFASPVVAADKSHPKSLDPELKIELFAEHPTIVTPTGIDVDYKGRVFAVESNTHFRPKDYKGHKSDRVLVLEDTNGDGKADKTTVFTDGLTHTMSVKVRPLWLGARGQNSEVRGQKKRKGEPRGVSPRRASNKNALSVYIATRRDIFLYHDTNNDLKADRRQSIIKLITKGNYPHNGLAGIAFDAMGWMYFGFGENLGAKYTIVGSDGTKLSGGGEGGNVYRCRPDGSKLSLWATGFWNPHASCVDAFGRLFTVDNDPDSRPPCRLLHIIEGGDYGFRFRNGRKGLHPFTAWNGEIPGTLPMVAGTGEAPSGIVAYESDGFPKKYIGNLLIGSWGDHRIDRFVLKPKGASFESRAEPFIQGGEDFRPVGLAVAPDGSLFCTDWVKRDYKLHGHGRVWRISRKSTSTKTSRKRKRAAVIDLSKITAKRPVKELQQLLSHARMDVRRMAAQNLRLIGGEKGYTALIQPFRSKSTNDRVCLEVAWQVAQSEQFSLIFFVEPFNDTQKGFPRVRMSQRVWNAMVDILRQISPKFPRITKRDDGTGVATLHGVGAITHLAGEVHLDQWKGMAPDLQKTDAWIRCLKYSTWQKSDADTVGAKWRSMLAKVLANRDPTQFGALIDALGSPSWILMIRKSLDEGEPRLALLTLLTSQRAGVSDINLIKKGLAYRSPDVRRAAVQWAAEENLKQLKPQVEAVLNGKVMNADLFLATLAALEMLDGKSPKDFDKTPAGKYVLPLVKDAKRSPAVRAQALRLVDPDDKRLDDQLFRELLGGKDAKLKLEAVRTLAMSNSKALPLLHDVAADSKADVNLRAEAIAGLAAFVPRLPTSHKSRKLVERLTQSKNRTLKIEAIRALRGTPFAKAEAMKQLQRGVGPLKKKSGPLNDADREVVAQWSRLFRSFDYYRLVEAYTKPLYKRRPADKVDWYALAKPQAAKGDAKAGRRVFFHRNSAGCYKCHTVNGRGGKIGPDLSYIARTASRKKLAESILEPSKEIAPQYTLWSFVMADGKVHHGMILGDTRNGKRQRIGTAEGKTIDLPLTQIELRKPQKKSLMPEKLIDQLTATEFRDLLAYLESLK